MIKAHWKRVRSLISKFRYIVPIAPLETGLRSQKFHIHILSNSSLVSKPAYPNQYFQNGIFHTAKDIPFFGQVFYTDIQKKREGSLLRDGAHILLKINELFLCWIETLLALPKA